MLMVSSQVLESLRAELRHHAPQAPLQAVSQAPLQASAQASARDSARDSARASCSIATGSRTLDDFFSIQFQPGRTGMLVEWFISTFSSDSCSCTGSSRGSSVDGREGTARSILRQRPGYGASGGWLALASAWGACGAERMLVIVDREGSWTERFYPPAAAALGIDLSRMLVLRPHGEQDAIWCLDQALRCRGVGGVWCEWDAMDDRVFRRLQLAAEQGHALGMLVRSAAYCGQPSWAHVQLLVESIPTTGSFPLANNSLLDQTTLEPPAKQPPAKPYSEQCDGESLSWLGGRRWRVELLRHRYQHPDSRSLETQSPDTRPLTTRSSNTAPGSSSRTLDACAGNV